MNKVKEYLKKRYNMEDRQSFLFNYIMIGFPFIVFCFLWVSININSILLAFQGDFGGFTLDHFKRAFVAFFDEDPYLMALGGGNLMQLIGRSFFLWVNIYIVCQIPSLFSSYVLYKKIPGHYVFRVIFMIPAILNGIVWVMIMKNMLSYNGPIMGLLKLFGYVPPADAAVNGFLGSYETAFPTIALMTILPHLVGFNMIISGAYARIPGTLFEVGKLEGIGFLKEFFIISIPLVWPTITVGLIAGFSSMLIYDGQVYLYTAGKYRTGTMGFYLYYLTVQLSQAGTKYYGYPAAIGLIMTLVTIPIVLVGKFVLERLIEPVEY